MSDLNILLKNWNAGDRNADTINEHHEATPMSAASMRMSNNKAGNMGQSDGSSIDGSSSANHYSNYRRASQIITAKIEPINFNKTMKEAEKEPQTARKYMQRRDAVMILNNMPTRMQTYY